MTAGQKLEMKGRCSGWRSKNLFLADVLAELPDEHRGKHDDPEREIVNPVEVILCDNDGMPRAGLQAHAAIRACRLVDGGFAVPDADGGSRAHVHAVRASRALRGDDFQGVVEGILFHFLSL